MLQKLVVIIKEIMQYKIMKLSGLIQKNKCYNYYAIIYNYFK